MPPPDGLCVFIIFEHVRVARQSDVFIASSNQVAFDNYMKMAAGNRTEQFLLSLSATWEYDESIGLRGRAVAIMRRYRDQNVHGYGFAHYRVTSTGIDSGMLWKQHRMLSNLRHWSKDPVVVFLGIEIYPHRSYSDAYITGLIADAAGSMDFLILRTHMTTPPCLGSKHCQVELISSWTKDGLNDKLLLSVVCHSNSTFLKGGRTKPTFCHYDDDPKSGRWRTYTTAVDIVNKMQSVAYSAAPSVIESLGWAFYDVDLEDYGGDCAAYWRVNRGTLRDSKTAAYYRLKYAVRQLRALRYKQPAVTKIQKGAGVSEDAWKGTAPSNRYSSIATRIFR
ncbi:uncharacterized protein [Dermacentor andersoni]|uniref:uncharacterized protein isoform X2 n=1 Tax=Dermacentor andersoni TaxID=34620 RepID=UPI003B3B954D